MRLSTAGSRAMTVIGTSWLAPVPGDDGGRLVVAEHDQHQVVVVVEFCTKETRVFSEYSIDCP